MKQTIVFVGVVVVVLSALVASAHGGAYVLDWEAKGATFLDKFNFMTHDDYSHGFVNYVNQSYAQCTLSLSLSTARSLRLAPRAGRPNLSSSSSTPD
jgi:hypothetical protein